MHLYAVQCSMRRGGMRPRIVFVTLVAIAATIFAQGPNVESTSPSLENDFEDVEETYTSELRKELTESQERALLLYTKYSARIGADLNSMLKHLAEGMREILKNNQTLAESAPEHCREDFQNQLRKITHESHKAASYSAENHSKYVMGYLIVFNMHLNKSEDHIKRCEKVIQGCGIKCETMPKLVRWRRMASSELYRAQDDITHSRRSYHDLYVHYTKRMSRIKKQAAAKSQRAIEDLRACT